MDHRRRIIPFRGRRTDDASSTSLESPGSHQFEESNDDPNDPGSIRDGAIVLASTSIERVEQVQKELRESLKIESYIGQSATGRFHLKVAAEAKEKFSAEIDAVIKGDGAGISDSQRELRRLAAEMDRSSREFAERRAEQDRRLRALEARERNFRRTVLSPREVSDIAQLRFLEAEEVGDYLNFSAATAQVIDAYNHRYTPGKELPPRVLARRIGYYIEQALNLGRRLTFTEAASEVIEAADNAAQAALEFDERAFKSEGLVLDSHCKRRLITARPGSS